MNKEGIPPGEPGGNFFSLDKFPLKNGQAPAILEEIGRGRWDGRLA